ncbi:MAG: energy transducer TonB, partial [Myxococcota bacterium]
PPPPPPVEAEPVEVAPAPRRPTPRRVARQTAPEPQAAPETAPPPEDAPPPAPVALGGLTLTGAGSGWSVGAGPGGRAGAPSRRGSAMAAAPVAAAPAAPAGPRLVREGDLSRRPRQPSSLASLLDQLYPAGARSRGEEGLARVRVRIGADGRARPMAVAYASAAPFGTACRQLLARSRGWQPGRDEDGNRVDTIIEFPCRFEVRP